MKVTAVVIIGLLVGGVHCTHTRLEKYPVKQKTVEFSEKIRIRVRILELYIFCLRLKYFMICH